MSLASPWLLHHTTVFVMIFSSATLEAENLQTNCRWPADESVIRRYANSLLSG
jgi:hypothetical protein